MPRVRQVSSSNSLTALTISFIFDILLSLRFLHAAPMQNLDAPDFFASFACAITSSTVKSFSISTSVLYFMLCEQYLQSSGQPPVLIDMSVDT